MDNSKPNLGRSSGFLTIIRSTKSRRGFGIRSGIG